MIESRLLQILFILMEKGSVTAPDLAERFEVSARTIYRDIDALSAAEEKVAESLFKRIMS